MLVLGRVYRIASRVVLLGLLLLIVTHSHTVSRVRLGAFQVAMATVGHERLAK